MLIATQGKSVRGTQRYFDQVLTRGDYYLGNKIVARWRGKGADLLGLGHGSEVTKQEFNALLEGKHPVTGQRLTQRNRQDRRPGTELTFSVPKSVSLAWAINGDERIIEALREAVHETMQRDVEPLMNRRVREGKHAFTKQRTPTDKLIYADFLHETSRPVDGSPDPHLHVHAFMLNWTEQNGKHYAGEFEEIVRQRPSLQAKFESRLARKLQFELGYAVQQTRYRQSGRIKAGWELKGIDRSTVEKFSRRTAQVEQFANENGVADAAQKGKLGKQTREKKDEGASVEQLRGEWRGRLSSEEQAAFERLRGGSGRGDEGSEQGAALESVQYALNHHLFRHSTVERHQVVGTALEHGLTLRPEMVEQTLDRLNVIERKVEANGASRQMITTREVLDAEKQMIGFVRDGRGTRKAISTSSHEFSREWLNYQQRDAVQHVLQSRDTVTAVTGGAGTGKSSLMQEAAEAIAKQGRQVFTFAPSTGAREVLQDKGFQDAQTVEHLIRNTKLHPDLHGQMLWIDEAGLMDVRSMNAVFKIAKEQDARVVLSGDTRQHASPRRGEAMRLLEREAGLHVARIETIQRQKGKYRAAVELISKGHEVVEPATGKTGLVAGFDMLNAMGKIKEINADERHEQLAKRYLEADRKGKSTLVVAPTHAEAQAVTEQIREKLRAKGKLATDEKSFTQLRSLNLTEAEKSEAMTYGEDCKGAIVQFHQNAKGGFKRGERFRVAGAIGKEVVVTSLDGAQTKHLPLNATASFEVYSEQQLAFAAGDKIRFSLGGTAADGKRRISNGRLDEVQSFDRQGNLVLKSGCVVDKNYGHFDLGYVVTSHASQGKDRHVAIAAMGSQSLPAINAKQFYVTVSRGSEDVTIYVDDKAKVRRAIQRSGEQLSATELERSTTATGAEQAREKGYDYVRQGRHAVRSFRDRVLHWWRGTRNERTEREPTGRHQGIAAASMFGMAMNSPEPGRSA